MKSNPVLPGGLLTSKPTWLSTFGVFRHVGFFCSWRRETCAATEKAMREAMVLKEN